jgi:c-di-GMP-binding flagellar brake protein YcgR
MTQTERADAIERLESEMDVLKRKVERNPDEDAMLNLARKMRSDHETVREAVQYADIPEKDKKKLLRLVNDL